jgi:hypothetical protein
MFLSDQARTYVDTSTVTHRPGGSTCHVSNYPHGPQKQLMLTWKETTIYIIWLKLILIHKFINNRSSKVLKLGSTEMYPKHKYIFDKEYVFRHNIQNYF